MKYTVHFVSKFFLTSAFETVPLFVWLTVLLSRPFKADRRLRHFFYFSLLLTVNGVMLLASHVCLQYVSDCAKDALDGDVSDEYTLTCFNFLTMKCLIMR